MKWLLVIGAVVAIGVVYLDSLDLDQMKKVREHIVLLRQEAGDFSVP